MNTDEFRTRPRGAFFAIALILAGTLLFLDNLRLTDRELAILTRWVEAGAPEGDPSDLPPPPQFTDGWQLGQPDYVFQLAEPFYICVFCFFGGQFSLDRLVRLGKLLHQFRADGEEIAARELEDLANVAKTCAHHFRLVTELLVIHVNFLHRLHPGIFRGRVIAFVRGFEPIVNAADEWRNELHLRFGGTHRLGQ